MVGVGVRDDRSLDRAQRIDPELSSGAVEPTGGVSENVAISHTAILQSLT